MHLEQWSAIRSIPPKTRGNRSYIPSDKVNGEYAIAESQLERDVYLLLNHDFNCLKFQHQPLNVHWVDQNGKRRIYTPDTLILFSDLGQKFLIEIKEDEEYYHLQTDQNEILKWEAAVVKARSIGAKFRILLKNKIRTARLANIWFTLGSSKVILENDLVTQINKLIPVNGIKYSELCRSIGFETNSELGIACQYLCSMIYHGQIWVPTFSTKNLTSETIIFNRPRNKFPFKSLLENWDLNSDSKIIVSSKINLSENLDTMHESINFVSIPEKHREKVNKRLEIVNKYLKVPKIKRNIEWREILEKKTSISYVTITRWVKSYKLEGIYGLIPRNKNAGRKLGFIDEVYDLMETLRKKYLKNNITQREAYNILERECRDKNYQIPAWRTFDEYIRRNSTKSEMVYIKQGRKYHKDNFTPSMGSFSGAIMPMQVLQFDNTSFDCFPVDSKLREVLPTPNLVASIDVYTGMITGFYLSLNPSSRLSILETLLQSINKKIKYENEYRTESKWLIEGFPVLILVDNGMDYRSNDLKNICMKYDIILEFAPLREPKYKSFIEQWFRQLRLALERDNVPGTRPPLKKRLERPDLDPERDAVLTMQEIETWLTQWIVDEYHFENKFDKLVLAPYFKYIDANTGQTDIILPHSPIPTDNQLTLMKYDILNREEGRNLDRNGITWLYLQYQSLELTEYYLKYGKCKVTLLIDPRDIRTLWVDFNDYDEVTTLIQAYLNKTWRHAFDRYFGDKPVSKSAWNKTRSFIRKYNRQRRKINASHLVDAFIKRQTIISEAKKSKKISKRMRRAQERDIENSNKRLVNQEPKNFVGKIEEINIKDEENNRKKTSKIPPVEGYKRFQK